MVSEGGSPSTNWIKCCDCGCSRCSYSGNTLIRSPKRKFDEFEEENNRIVGSSHVARIDLGNECFALREMVGSQQKAIRDLSIELEAERNASSSAASEAMSMILRLQREKAEAQMEARQFKRLTEEKMSHDQQEISAFEDLLYKKEQAIYSLTCEIQAYKYRMMSYGFTEAELEEGGVSPNLDSPVYDYPPLKCDLNPIRFSRVENEVLDVDKYAFGETPRSQDHLKDLENRINQLERSPRNIMPDAESFGSKDVLEMVIVGHSPRRPRHFRRFSTNSLGSFFTQGRDSGSDFSPFPPTKLKKMEDSHLDEYNSKKMDNSSDLGDEMSDRIYTIDSVHISDDYMATTMEPVIYEEADDPEIKKLYARLQALEADRESMRQAIISMRTDKAQLVLLKEIAQNLCKEMAPARRAHAKKWSFFGIFSFLSVFKWVASFAFWRKKSRRSRYMFGLSSNSAGLLMLLDKGPRVGKWRCLSNTEL